MANKQAIPTANTKVQPIMVSSQMQAANVRSNWRAPDWGGVLKQAAQGMEQYAKAEKDAAFKQMDIEASTLQTQQLEKIRVAQSADEIPQIEKDFQNQINQDFTQRSWGKQWLQEKGSLFFAINKRDVTKTALTNQKERSLVAVNKTVDMFANDIANSDAEKAKVLMGDMDKYIGGTGILSPEETQEVRNNAKKIALQRVISNKPGVALEILGDNSLKWSENGIDINEYKQLALASAANADRKRLVNQINSNRQVAADLIGKSQETQLSLDEINKTVPESCKELRDFLYKLNGYASGDGKIKLSDAQKAINAEELHSGLAVLISNPKTTIEDWQNYEKKVYQAMSDNSVDKSVGIQILDNFATPFMNMYQNTLKDAGNNHIWSRDFGYEGLNKWIKDSVLPNEIKEKDYKNNKALYKKLVAGQARVKADIYQKYNDALIIVAKEAGLKNVADINNLSSGKQDELYGIAQDMVQKNWNMTQFSRLRSIAAEKQPNAVLANGRLVNNSNSLESAKQGKPVKNEGYTTVGGYKVRIIE